MSYTVLHLEKAKGNDAAMSAHIERTIQPKNADALRSHLNKELIIYPKGIKNRTGAIQNRLESANLKRKIGINQVRAIRILLSGTHQTMKAVEKNKQLGNWCKDNLDWLKETFGEENLVSAVLHMDEKTPHIHATIVPIVKGERRKLKQAKQIANKTSPKNNNHNRLCADDVMARNMLKHYQNTYALAMTKYGLRRGIEGSKAKHISTIDYYRDLSLKNQKLEQEKNRREAELKKLEKTVSTKKVFNNLNNVLTGSKTKRLEKENDQIKKELNEIKIQNKQEKDKTEQTILKLNKKVESQDKILDKLKNYHPDAIEIYQIVTECEKMGLPAPLIKSLLEKKELVIKGQIYSSSHFKSFEVENLKLSIEKDPKTKSQHLKIDRIHSSKWFEMKYKKSLRNESKSLKGQELNKTQFRR